MIAVKLTLSDTPRAQDNLTKLLTAFSAIATPSDGTLQNLCRFLLRVSLTAIKSAANAVSDLVNRSTANAVRTVKD